MIHPLAWLIWLAAVVTVVSLVGNPLYLLLLFLALGLVAQAARRSERGTPVPVAPERFALVVVPVAALFNALFTPAGSTVLVRLPERWPVIGGAVTAEALLYGATNGLALAMLLAAFSALVAAVPTRELIRLVPRAFYPLAVVLSISVSFVPAVLRQLEQVREAQAVRGHRMRGVRDWFPLFLPLLVGGLERALQLAEALTARGFVLPPAARRRRWQLLIVGALLALLAGLLALLGGARPAGWLLLGSGTLLLALLLWRMGRGREGTTYRRLPWSLRDGWVVAGAAAALLGLLLGGREGVAYSPYPQLTLPPFDPWRGMALLGLLLPALWLGRRRP